MTGSAHTPLRRLLAAFALLALLLGLASCGGGGSSGGGGGIGGTGSPSTLGTVNFALTDAPACGYDAVNVTIERVRVHASNSAAESDSGWSEVVLQPARRVNLLDLTNGVLVDLGQTRLPAGKYTQLRLVLGTNGGATPLANSVVPSGGVETALTTPSAAQSGIKVDLDLDVAEGQTADVVLDFDACKSVVRRGNSGAYNLKPRVTAISVTAGAGQRVVGYLAPAIARPTTQVSVQTAGVPVKSTVPDGTGTFVLYPVPPGTYDLVVTSAGHVTALVTGVTVSASTQTDVNSTAARIDPPSAPTRTVSGTVSPASANVRALQAYTTGPTVEAGFAPVDAISGGFSLALPIGPPVRAAFGSTLAFAPDAGAASKFTLEASTGSSPTLVPIDVTSAVPPLSVTVP
jgi:hypothetical protein